MSVDSRREERRRKILENSEKRLEKLTGLKRDTDSKSLADGPDLNPLTEECEQANLCVETGTNKQLESVNCDQNDEEGSFDEQDVDESEKEIEDSPTVQLASNMNVNADKKDLQPGWFIRKYRLILFALLAWVVYLVVIKDFDYILSYVIGQKLPKQVLPKMFFSAFVAVEVQVVMLELFFKKKTVAAPTSMLFLALKLSGMKDYILSGAQLVLGCFSSAVTDFCVYLFVIVVLFVVDEIM